VEKVLHDYRAYQRVRPGWLGADVRVTDAPEGGSNARLRALRSDGPGAKGKLRAGDVLLQIGRWKITSPDDVYNAAFYITASEPLEVKVSRAGKVRTLSIVPSDPPDGAEPKIYREEPTYLGATDGK
jgi:S1-C subfamily serine protease